MTSALRWARIAIYAEPEQEDTAAAALRAIGCGGTEHPNPGEAVGYLPVDDRLQPILASLRTVLDAWPRLGIAVTGPRFALTFVADEEWSSAWKSHFHPLLVGRRLIVRPPWHSDPVPPDRLAVEIDPGMAFGTGHHATTRLCLEALERYVRPGSTVLDAGTGSGVLSIAAVKLGAARAVGFDCDLLACRIAAENARANGVGDRVYVLAAESLQAVAVQADVVVANILAHVVAAMAPDVFALLSPGGAFIASGIVAAAGGSVRTALLNAGFKHAQECQEGEWISLEAHR